MFSKKVNRIIRRPTSILQDLWQKFFRLTGWCSGIAPSEYSGEKSGYCVRLAIKGLVGLTQGPHQELSQWINLYFE